MNEQREFFFFQFTDVSDLAIESHNKFHGPKTIFIAQ